MKTGLILGGGGIVGIAWEIGVMAGLAEHAGFDPLAMEVIVGTSAGSVAGAQVALGRDLGDLVERQRKAPKRPTASPGPVPSPGSQAGIGTSVIPEELMRLFFSARGTVEERAVAISSLAKDIPVALSEDDYVASFQHMLGTDQWPDRDLRLTTAQYDTGQTVHWTRKDGIDLARAVASSCAIPGYFPSVEFDGHRYMDGPRHGHTDRIVEEKSLDSVLFIGPLGRLPGGQSMNPEIDALADAGFPVVRVTGGAALSALAADLMDPGARMAGVEAGLDDGVAQAKEVATILG